MKPAQMIRAVAVLDLLITLPLALPVFADVYLVQLLSGFGLLDTPALPLPLPLTTSLFCNLAGVPGGWWKGAGRRARGQRGRAG